MMRRIIDEVAQEYPKIKINLARAGLQRHNEGGEDER